MGVYVKGNPKEGEYKLIKTTDGFVLEGKDIAYACIEIDLVRCGECKQLDQTKWCDLFLHYMNEDDFCSYGERRTDE